MSECRLFVLVLTRPMKRSGVFILMILGIISQTLSQRLDAEKTYDANQVVVGAERTELYLNDLKGKRVALVVNPTSTVFDRHLVDFLVDKGVAVKKVFAPEQ